MKLFFFSLLLCSGCYDVTIYNQTCKSNEVLLVPSQDDNQQSIATYSIIVNMKNVTGELTQVGTIQSHLINNDLVSNESFSWVNHVTIVIIPIIDTIHYHTLMMVDQDVRTDSNWIELISLLTDQELSGFVQQGTVEFDITLQGSMPSDTMLAQYNFCIDLIDKVHKGI